MPTPVPAPDSAPQHRSEKATAVASAIGATTRARSKPPTCPVNATAANGARRDSNPPTKSDRP